MTRIEEISTLCSGKSEAYVTIIKDSARFIILLRLTTGGHKASRGLFATAELLVCFKNQFHMFTTGFTSKFP